MFQQKYTLRISLDDIVKDKDLEQVVIENVRRCRQISGKEFQVVFWNRDLSENDCKNFIKRNEKMLFEITSQITSVNSSFDNCWFLIDLNDSDKCKRRYCYKGGILTGIAEYIKMVKHFKRSMNEDSDSWKS